MKKRLFIIAVTVLWIFSTGMAFGAPVGKFTDVKGLVDLTATDGSLREIKVGDPVSVGDIVRTKSRSSAEITFSDSSVVRLARNSRLKINEYMVGDKETRGILKLFRGKAQSIVSKAAGFFGFKTKNKFEMHTPTAVCGVRGTNFFTWYNQGTSGVAVREGTVYNYAANKPTEVKEVRAGQSSIVVSADEDPVVGTATEEELSLGEEEEDATPSAFVGEPEEDLFAPVEEDEPLVEVSDTDEIVPEAPVDSEPDFLLQLAGGFLTGTLTGDGNTLDLSGTYNSASAASTMAVGGDQSNGGALEGYLGGVLGSWEGMLSSIYVDPDGGAGFIYGTLSGDVTGDRLNATGSKAKTAALGTVADPAADLELATLYHPATIIGIPDADPTVEGLLTTNVDTGADRWLGVFSLTATDSGFSPLAEDAYYGLANSGTYSGVDAEGASVDIPYLMVGYVNIKDDQAGHISLTDQGNLFYIDPLYHGTYDVNYRGVYDDEGEMTLSGSGMFILDPLDYSGFWGGEAGTVFFNDAGYAGGAATDFGLMGLVASATGYDFYAAGDYFLTGAVEETGSFVWGTEIGGEDMTGSGDDLEGYTAGVWQYSANSYGLPGDLVGAAAALKVGSSGGQVTVEQLFGDLRGEYFTVPLNYEESDGLFRVRGDLDVASLTAAEEDLEVIHGSFDQTLAGDLGAAGAMAGYGGGYLTAYMDAATGRGLGAFSIELGYGGVGLDSLSLGYGGNIYSGRAAGPQNISGLAGGKLDYTVAPWAEIGTAQAVDGFGYYLADVDGTLNADGSLIAGLAGTLMTQTFIADMTGDLFGQGEDGEIAGDGTWIGQGVGILDSVAALAFSGFVDYADDWDRGPYYGLYSGYGGYFDTWGDVYALVGSTVSPWRYDGAGWLPRATDVLIMGEAWGIASDGQYIWNDEVYSWNAVADDDTTYDGGSFNGFVGGVFSDGRINGWAATLYMDPDGNAGVLTGAADGEYYVDLAMMRAGGTWTPVQKADAADLGIAPVDFYDAVYTDATMTAMATGSFGGAGSLFGYSVPFGDSYSYGGGWTRFIGGQHWGIYDFKLSGYEDSYYGYGGYGGYGGTVLGGYDKPSETTAWSATVGGSGVFGSHTYGGGVGELGADAGEMMLDEGYWLGSVTAGNWSGGTLEGVLSGRFMTPVSMGVLDGRVFGYYDDAGNWAATSLGTFEGDPLSHVARLGSSIYHASRRYEGEYGYTGGTSAYYEYRYNADNSYGYVRYYSSDGPGGLPDYRVFFDEDGSYERYDYETSSYSGGNWNDPEDPYYLADFSELNQVPSEFGEDYVTHYQEDYITDTSSGYLSGYLGGTASLWTGTDIPVTAMGSFTNEGGRSVWFDEIYSRDYLLDERATYDGGAYEGYFAGIHDEGALDGRFMAIYVDPDGNAGYLGGALAGSAYADIGMFEMDGVLNRRFVTGVDFAPEQLDAYLAYYGGGMALAGTLGTEGRVQAGGYGGAGYGGYGYGYLDTLAIAGQHWGVYGAEMFGEFTNPELATTWNSKTGGQAAFGSYLDSDLYEYPDFGYWLADTASTWAEGKIGADVDGRYITMTQMGTLTGELLGTYTGDTEGYWEAISLGTWQGASLSFASGFGYGGYGGYGEAYSMPAILVHALKYYEGKYCEVDVPDNYYRYEYTSDNTYGYKYRQTPDGVYTETYYYGDGTTYTYDSATGQETYGTWDPETFDLGQLADDIPEGLTNAIYAYEDLEMGYGGLFAGILGGTDDLWTNDNVDATVLGSYTGFDIYSLMYGIGYGGAYGGYNGVWLTELWSYDVLDDTATTLSGSGAGGAYYGYFGGTLLDNAMDGMLTALYLDPDGNLGFLLGDFDGTAYPDIAAFEMAGVIDRYPIVAGYGGLPEEFAPYMDNTYIYGAYGGLADRGLILGYGGMGLTAAVSWYESLLGGLDASGLAENQRTAGVWTDYLYGGYFYDGTFDNDTTWTLYAEGDFASRSGGFAIVVDGDRWTGGKSEGRVAGAWVDLSSYTTGVLGGQLKGTFDAAHATWEAVASGEMLDTETFLAMAGTEAGRSALQAMNIPGFEVGRVDLRGTHGTDTDFTVNMWDTTFFAHDSASAPKVWGSGAVTGTNPNALSGTTVALSGGGVTADFNMDSYVQNGNWRASVENGAGTVGGYNVAFHGAAAGQAVAGTDPNNGGASIDFSGTSSGVVAPEIPVVVE